MSVFSSRYFIYLPRVSKILRIIGKRFVTITKFEDRREYIDNEIPVKIGRGIVEFVQRT